MKFFKEVALGFSSFGESLTFVRKHNLWLYVFLPGVINIFLLILVYIFASKTGGFLSNFIMDFFGLKSGWLLSSFDFFISFLIKVLIFFFYSLFYKYLILIIMSPVMALLSEKTEQIISGKTYPFNLERFLKDIARGIKIATRNIIVEILIVSLLWIYTFIPLIGFLGPIFIFIIQSYFYGFSMIDYYNERKRLTVRQSIKFIRSHKAFAFANGVIFYLLFLIPFFGWLIAPTIGVVSATLGAEKINAKY
ncbi:MAG: hypothetical protein HN704_02115 [Bacteroidetes bacterium]|jgi:CysZ protein|nr:hypothetical protein [Bacteroidota bacterium]MBT6686062.1 hypothetical protein [Bacteroidota bacterium]MBT7144306.1 hypothetical protein [Bacteroidota bacterium]MBT7490381.1 hypothetical protein [Bacteroidota bacterium]